MTNTKPGRNDPCYCGSGKKYKHCHLAADQAAENERRQALDAGRWLRRDLLSFARDERFAEAFAAALPLYWNNFYTVDNAEQMSQYEALRFFDWFVFDYQPGDQPRLIEVYHAERREDLSTHQQQLLDAWLNAPPSGVYELLDYEGQILHVCNFVTGEEFHVYEPGGRGVVETGELLLGRIVPVLDQLEFSVALAYLPHDEIADLGDKLEKARAADAEGHPGATPHDFMRRQGHLAIHHALEQAEKKGRPPVAARDPQRADQLARKAAQRIRQLRK
ncbi:MAG: SEC-C domain-containing protein [Chloroflexi bacterium]|nr:SEC-C domain-containing protein [Chloroflexota bacterium]